MVIKFSSTISKALLLVLQSQLCGNPVSSLLFNFRGAIPWKGAYSNSRKAWLVVTNSIIEPLPIPKNLETSFTPLVVHDGSGGKLRELFPNVIETPSLGIVNGVTLLTLEWNK